MWLWWVEGKIFLCENGVFLEVYGEIWGVVEEKYISTFGEHFAGKRKKRR